MSQIVLEFSNREDLALLLSLAKRLNANVLSVKSDGTIQEKNNRHFLLQQAANDPLFLADIGEISDDFKHVDTEHI